MGPLVGAYEVVLLGFSDKWKTELMLAFKMICQLHFQEVFSYIFYFINADYNGLSNISPNSCDPQP